MSMFPSCRFGLLRGGIFVALAAGVVGQVHAVSFDMPFGEERVEGVLNTTITAGAAWRMQAQSSDLIGKANLPGQANICGPDPNAGAYPEMSNYQACQGLFKTQYQPAARLAQFPGAYSVNGDDGDLNYNKHDMVSAVAKVTQDLSLKYGDFGFFAKALYFYDKVNNNFTEFHPHAFTKDNYQVQTNGVAQGGTVYRRRSSGATLDQIGSQLQFLETYFYGKLPLPLEKELTFKVGRQLVNWGESTLMALNSINSANPVNANNFFRVGFQVEEVFTPVNMVFLSMQPFEGATLETFYQLEWKPLQAPAAGSFLSNQDTVGTSNAVNHASLGFGGEAEDLDLRGDGVVVGGTPGGGYSWPTNNPLSGVTPLSTYLPRINDLEPRKSGQYGIALKYYAEWLNNGTELGFYHMNYHSRLPFASIFSTQASCARREGNSLQNDATNPIEFLQDCPNIPLLAPAGTPKSKMNDAVPLDTERLMIEYPENIKLYGLSFNTTAGDWSFQGEVAYRPNSPLQVDPVDLVFAGFGPTLSRCHRYNCQGTAVTPNNANVGALIAGLAALPNNAQAAVQYGPSDTNPGCTPNSCDTFTLGVGHAPGSARAFPNFVIPYRGGVMGENAPTDKAMPLDHNNPGYIQGFERFQTLQYNLGGTSVLGATDVLPAAIAADQILFLFEVGATHVPGLPSLDELQITSEVSNSHASAGADGTGADGSRQACSYNSFTPAGQPACVVGVDGLRFNPHQADLSQFATKFSWGYDMITLIRYESVLPGISLQPQIIVKHDVKGNAPGPGPNFVEGRKTFDVQLETRYKSFLSWYLGYTWYTGGGSHNTLRDRDALRTFVKYQF